MRALARHALLAAALSLLVWASADGAAAPAEPQADALPSVVVEGTVERAPASLMLSLHGGLPAYRAASIGAAVKADAFGVALRGAWGSVGGSFGAQLRWYAPLPGAVPVYVGVGADAYAGNLTPHGVVGSHIPLGPAWRLDLEGGVASATLAGERVWTPHLSVGIAYAISLDLPAAGASDGASAVSAATRAAASRCEPGPADPAQLDAAVDREVRSFVRDGVALYGNAYRDLRYRYAIVERSLSGERASVRIRYEGSARAVLGGERVEASGEADASFAWTGCGWRLDDLRY